MGESKPDPSFADREQELDILQRRLHNKAQRAARVIQLNIITLSVVVAVIRLGSGAVVQLPPLFYAGGTVILVSTFYAVVAIVITEAPLNWLERAEAPPNVQNLTIEYRDRNRWLGQFVPAALVTSGMGAVIILLGGMRLAGIDPFVPVMVLVPAIVVAGGGAVVVAFRTAS